MDPMQIGRDEVISLLKRAGDTCSMRVIAYLIGGGAMALRGEKDATKDIDLVLDSEKDAEALRRAFEAQGFMVNSRHPAECHAMVDAEILSRPTGLRVDIFVGRICDRLRFSEGMRARSTLVGEFGNIVLYMCSREDIFILKSVTERTRDLDDMISLFRRGLDKDSILEECELQSAHVGLRQSQIWEAFLFVKVEEMERRHGVNVPWKRSLKAKAEMKVGSQNILVYMEKGARSVTELSHELKESQEFVRKCLHYLEEAGEIVADRGSRPYRFTISTGSASAATNL
ncbi:MAG TPA: nucleotidyl transferase AbiEii/AbiGii toxin family protein [Thermoplasmata archaeon]|nr:nucleotidyl transferase AbiEii/AbiGii toxin family protein [Thermoplasmata archaeon]